jgi:hypothetical protein
MRIAVSVLIGAALAAGASFGAVQFASASKSEPVSKPLYNYGSR